MIKIIEGDLFDSKAKIIAHQVNCKGKMGSGVALQVKQKYPHVFSEYRDLCSYNVHGLLGYVQLVCTNKYYAHMAFRLTHRSSSYQYICNMFAQDNYGYDGKQYTDIKALERCFYILHDYGASFDYTIAMPYKIGCCRGGADWNEVYAMIERIFTDCDVELWKLDKG